MITNLCFFLISVTYRGKVKHCTLPSFANVEGREFQSTFVSINFFSSTKPNTTAGSKDSQHFADIGILHLVELLTDFISIPISFLLDLWLELSSKLSYPAQKTGETCECKSVRRYKLDIKYAT